MRGRPLDPDRVRALLAEGLEMRRCLYIAFEGPKGSEKTTAFEAVVRALPFPVRLLCPTRPMEGHPWLERLARGGWAEQCDRLRERLYAARSNRAAERACLDEPGVVLGDRSVLTSLVTRWVPDSPETRRRVVARVRRLEHRIRAPDHVVYCDAPLDVLLGRLGERRRRYGRRDERPDRFAAAVAAYADRARPPDRSDAGPSLDELVAPALRARPGLHPSDLVSRPAHPRARPPPLGRRGRPRALSRALPLGPNRGAPATVRW